LYEGRHQLKLDRENDIFHVQLTLQLNL